MTYDSSDAFGKTSEHTDTYRGRFVPNRQVIELVEFETIFRWPYGRDDDHDGALGSGGGADVVVHDGNWRVYPRSST